MSKRSLGIITGANGGMGRASARLLGATMDLLLTDAAPELKLFANELEDEGYTIVGTVVGGLGAQDVLSKIVDHVDDKRGFAALVHTCGLGPSAHWRDIIDVNYVASVKLLNALGPLIRPGSVAVLIASVAGHLATPTAEVERILADPLAPSLLDDLEAPLSMMVASGGESALGMLSYSLSKRKVLELAQSLAAEWGDKKARIVSISPGMIYTSMGRHEAARDALAETMVTATPVGRWGTSMEIAQVAAFLISPAASFITGSDIKVDGGSLASAQLRSREEWQDGLRGTHQ